MSSILPLGGDGESAVAVKELPELLTSQLQLFFACGMLGHAVKDHGFRAKGCFMAQSQKFSPHIGQGGKAASAVLVIGRPMDGRIFEIKKDQGRLGS